MKRLSRKYLIKKFLQAILTTIAVVIFNFFLFRVLPGDPVAVLCRSPNMSAAALHKLRAIYGLDQPAYIQFLVYLKQMFTGSMGTSFIYNKSVLSVIGSRLFASLLLTLTAQVIAIVLGILLGVMGAWKRGKRADLFSTGLAMITYAMPTFWLGILMIVFFSGTLGLFPTSGMTSPALVNAFGLANVLDILHHLFLPSVTLGIVLLGQYALVMRNSLTDILTEDYITTAYGKGMTAKMVLRRHAMPNAMIPVVTMITMNIGFSITGALQVETVFSWPGIGRLMYTALQGRDYPLLQGIFFITCVCVIGANFIADVLYGYMDPRIRH